MESLVSCACHAWRLQTRLYEAVAHAKVWGLVLCKAPVVSFSARQAANQWHEHWSLQLTVFFIFYCNTPDQTIDVSELHCQQAAVRTLYSAKHADLQCCVTSTLFNFVRHELCLLQLAMLSIVAGTLLIRPSLPISSSDLLTMLLCKSVWHRLFLLQLTVLC